MISFIVPLNERKTDRLLGLVNNLSKIYKDDLYEIIVVEQDIDEPFRLGQMRNLGFQKSKGDLIVFIDVDIRLKKRIDFSKEISLRRRPLVCWEFIIQVDEDEYYNIIEREGRRKGVGKGGCIAFTRKQFEKAGGNTNLIVGWGKEDDILKYRSDMVRLMGQEIYHVFHEDKREKWGLGEDRKFLGIALDRNVRIANLIRDGKVNKLKDGYAQTKADCKIIKDSALYRHYLFSNVGVSSDFEYMDLYNEIDKLLKKGDIR